MTKFYFIFLLLFIFCSEAYSQIVNIPDSNFKAVLLANPAINTNGDLEIQISEADSFNDVLESKSQRKTPREPDIVKVEPKKEVIVKKTDVTVTKKTNTTVNSMSNVNYSTTTSITTNGIPNDYYYNPNSISIRDIQKQGITS